MKTRGRGRACPPQPCSFADNGQRRQHAAGSVNRGPVQEAPTPTRREGAGGRHAIPMVRKGGLEPPRLAALEPKSRASTNSATFAQGGIMAVGGRYVDRRWTASVGFDAACRMEGTMIWRDSVGTRHACRRHARTQARKKPPGGPDGFRLGGLSRIRTLDLLIKSQLLYQLS